MYSLDKFFALLDKYAPLYLSEKMIEKGHYDNSGIIVKSHDTVSNALFCLDLTVEAINKAKRLKCDTIVTHHPAIYSPIKSLDYNGDTGAVLYAMENKMNVISMHLNLDIANGGIDACFCKALGGDKYTLLDNVFEGYGYGRAFNVNTTLLDFVKGIRKTFKTNKVVYFGKRNKALKKVASFCGAGYEDALKAVENDNGIDAVITADMPHHVIKAILEKGVAVVLLTHYATENVGFNEYYKKISAELKDAKTFYFNDKRFN